MTTIATLYRHSLALLTDLYQLTMAQGYWKTGAHQREAVFHQFFRRAPFKGGYAIACGVDVAAEVLSSFRFDEGDTDYLATIRGNDDQPLFDEAFLSFLKELEFTLDVEMVPEGTIVFPHEPLVRVRGPLIQCQLVETMLLNIVNFQTLIATKASRICRAARGEAVLEFGLRRAHGVDGGLSASRAAYVGGCAATSNVLAGKLFGIPVKGTHAHSWVMSFDREIESFKAYAEAMPNNCVFLVDTYDTLEGVRRATEVGRWLREQGHEMVGIRLDSGDLTELSKGARQILDGAGFEDAAIVASNDLDEHSITRLKAEGATISVWGVGTKLATAFDEPALGGVYKLAAIRDDAASEWQYKVKRSEQAIKTSNPGIQQVRRFRHPDGTLQDMIYDELLGPGDPSRIVSMSNSEKRAEIGSELEWEDLLRPVMREGSLVTTPDRLDEAKGRARQGLEGLSSDLLSFVVESKFAPSLEERLWTIKADLLERAKTDES